MANQFFKELIDNNPKHLKDEVAFNIALVKRVRELLKEQNSSQQELASSMEKKPSEVSKLLSGTHNLTLSSIFKLSDALGVKLIEVARPKTVTPVFNGECKVYGSGKVPKVHNFKKPDVQTTVKDSIDINKRTFKRAF